MMKKCLINIAAAGICAALLSSCAELFQGKVSMGTDYETATLADVLTPNKEIDQLSSPSQIFVSNGDSPSEITISWTPVADAASYRLERAIVTAPNENGVYEAPDDSDYEVIPGTSSSSATLYNQTTFIDTILSQNAMKYTAPEYSYRYYYRVSAENAFMGYGPSEFTACENPGTLFAPPTEIKATTGSSDTMVSISWQKSKSPTVQEYSIYRSENENGTNAVYLTSVKSNMSRYNDMIAEQNRGTAYYYTVYAQNRSGVKSCAGALAMGYARAEGAPPQVTGVKVTNGRGTSSDSITISWDNAGAVNYAVYRSSSKDSALTLLTAGQTGTTLEDKKNLSPNVYYYYQVQAWTKDPGDDTKKIKGQLSDSGKSSTSPAEGFILSAPETVSVSKGANGHTMAWSPAIGTSDEQAAYSYKIMGSNDQSGPFDNLVATVTAASLGIPFDGMYYHQIPEASTWSYYKISTLNDGVESEQSAVTAPAPFAPQSISVTRTANLSSEMGSDFTCNVNEVYPVKITWTAPSESSDVKGYLVYRSENRDRGYKKLSIGNDEKSYLISGNTFYDTNPSARPGKIYYYKVLSVNFLEQGTNYSSTEFGYGALTSNQFLREYMKTINNSLKKLTLMHKSDNMAKLGQETKSGAIVGTLSYDAHVNGLSGRVIMRYDDYADFYVHSSGKIDSNPLGESDETDLGNKDGIYFHLTGNTNTSAGMDTNGTMDGTVECKGMYPGTVFYNNVQIKGGAAGGGYYVVTREGFSSENVNWTVGNE